MTTPKSFGRGSAAYPVSVHSAEVAPLLRDRYTADELHSLRQALSTTLTIPQDARGLARAADRMEEGQEDPTHYDAIWVRDSLWVYLGLNAHAGDSASAKRLLLTLSDYFASPDQLKRFESMIARPSLMEGEKGPMNVVHIRFDGKSPDFQDVRENGVPQKWNHKQNDALGLFLDLFCRAVLTGEITKEDLTPQRLQTLSLFPKYFAAIRFHEMADAGSWEEIERVNTSSIALVTSGLERLQELAASGKLPPAVKLDRRQISRLTDQGYARIRKQLAQGGESPLHEKGSARYRTSDAALLNLIYPARLSRLKRADYERVVRAVEPLIGEVGIKRYLGDSYQSGNFWFAEALQAQARSQAPESRTDDTSSAADFLARGKKFIEGSEAQWFFDSWYSLAMGLLHEKYGEERYRQAQWRFLNRALAQITGGTAKDPVLGADGQPVPPRALPESYNTLVDPKTGERVFAPSPITPLNWAKASLRLALSQAAKSR